MTPVASLFLLAISARGVLAGPINRQVGISENVFITVQNDTYGNEQRVCSIDSVTYVDGDSIPTSSPCEHCICRPPGFACTIISCEYRPGCKVLKRSNQCCPEYQCECEKDGKIYQNGEKILDNNNPCEVCYCQGGDVICAVIDCYWRSDCQPRYIENRCCPLYDHCPPPSGDLGPLRPTHRPTTTTTTTTQVPLWFNQTIVESKPPPAPQDEVPIKENLPLGPIEQIPPVPIEQQNESSDYDQFNENNENERPNKIVPPIKIIPSHTPLKIIDEKVLSEPVTEKGQEMEGSNPSVEGTEGNEIVPPVFTHPIDPVSVEVKDTPGPKDPQPISLVELKGGEENAEITTVKPQEEENSIIEEAPGIVEFTTTIKTLEFVEIPSVDLLPPKEDENEIEVTTIEREEETTPVPVHLPIGHKVEEEIPQTTFPPESAQIQVTQISVVEDEKVEESKGEFTTTRNHLDEEIEQTTEKATEKGESYQTTNKIFTDQEIPSETEIFPTTSLPQDEKVEDEKVEDEKDEKLENEKVENDVENDVELTTIRPSHNFRLDPSIFDDEEEQKTTSSIKFIEISATDQPNIVEMPRKDVDDVQTTVEPKVESGRNEFRILSFDSEEETTLSGVEKSEKSDFGSAATVVTEIPLHDEGKEETTVEVKVEGNLRDDVVTTEIPHSDDVEFRDETTVVPIHNVQSLYRHHHPDHHGHEEEATTQTHVLNDEPQEEKIEFEVREIEGEVTTISPDEKPKEDQHVGISEKPSGQELVDVKENGARLDFGIETTTENVEPQTGESIVEEIATTNSPQEQKNETMKKTNIVIPAELIKKAEPISDDINLVEERGRWGLYDNGATNEVSNTDETWLWRNRIRNIPQFPALRRRSRKPRETIKVDELLMEKATKIKKPSFHHKKVKWPVYKQRESILS